MCSKVILVSLGLLLEAFCARLHDLQLLLPETFWFFCMIKTLVSFHINLHVRDRSQIPLQILNKFERINQLTSVPWNHQKTMGFVIILWGKKLICLYLRTLHKKYPNTELFLVRIFLYSDWIRRDMEYFSVFSPNIGKYGPEITPYLDTFHALEAKFGDEPLKI